MESLYTEASQRLPRVQRGLIVKVMSVDDWCEAGLFLSAVRWLECLMFSLLVALLCIFPCQRRTAIWTARALQRPAGHPSSSRRPWCSAWAERRWFVMTWEPADRQVSSKTKKNETKTKQAAVSLLSCVESSCKIIKKKNFKWWHQTIVPSYLFVDSNTQGFLSGFGFGVADSRRSPSVKQRRRP